MKQPSKLVEDLLIGQASEPAARVLADTRYNGTLTASDTAVGIDTRDYDEMLIILDLGLFATGASVVFTVNEYATDDSSSSTAITGATLGTITPANDQRVITANLKVKNYARYIYIKAVQANTNSSAYSVSYILGKADTLPVSQSQTVAFDL